MSFEQILKKTLRWEGGFSDDKDDRGGATNFGITISTLRALEMDIDKDGTTSKKDIKALTKEAAEKIYEEHYYIKPKFNILPEALQPVLFDMGVNHGTKRATQFLQHVINLSGFLQILEDGILGKSTLRATDMVYQKMGHYLINAICDERQAFYNRIVANDPSQQKFMNGWTNRNNDFRVLSA
jgi:lysozyme family protein